MKINLILILCILSGCAASMMVASSAFAIPGASCLLSCSRVNQNDWRWTAIGCQGGTYCSGPVGAPCPDLSGVTKQYPGICRAGGYRNFTPVFEPIPTPFTPGRLPTCGEVKDAWLKRMYPAIPPKSFITSMRMKECIPDEMKMREPGFLKPSPGCTRSIIETSDHQNPPTRNAQRCCMQQCPEDQWSILNPALPSSMAPR